MLQKRRIGYPQPSVIWALCPILRLVVWRTSIIDGDAKILWTKVCAEFLHFCPPVHKPRNRWSEKPTVTEIRPRSRRVKLLGWHHSRLVSMELGILLDLPSSRCIRPELELNVPAGKPLVVRSAFLSLSLQWLAALHLKNRKTMGTLKLEYRHSISKG